MTNTKLFLLLGTSLSLVPQTMSAAECAVTDCSLLGYTDSACPGSGLKCPFGEGWYCGGGAAEDCIKLGYDKDCTGAGESGSGETCIHLHRHGLLRWLRYCLWRKIYRLYL